MAAIPESFVLKSGLPIAQGDHSLIICLSTQGKGGSDSLFYQCMDMEDSDGTKFFNTTHISSRCNPCIKRGINDCPHVIQMNAGWLQDENSRKGREFQKIYERNPEAYEMEIKGNVSEDMNKALDSDLLNFLMVSPNAVFSPSNKPEFAVIIIDPANGGPSEMGVAVLVYSTDGKIVVSTQNSENCHRLVYVDICV